jgi:hypothetical protein
MSGGGVGPSIGHGPEASALLYVQQVARAAGQPVEARHQQHVPSARRLDCALRFVLAPE